MSDVESEPIEEPSSEPIEEPFSDDNVTDDNGSVDVEAEVLFQIAHYVDEYGGPASLADVAFEVQEKDTDVHKALEEAVEKGIPKVKPAVESLLSQGLIVETEYGGYITTDEGDAVVKEPEVQSELGTTYESKKNKGNPEGEGIADDLGVPPDVEEFDTEEEEPKSEMGVPFLNEA